MLSLQRIKFLRDNLNLLSPDEKREALEEIALFETEMVKKAGQKDFLSFGKPLFDNNKKLVTLNGTFQFIDQKRIEK